MTRQEGYISGRSVRRAYLLGGAGTAVIAALLASPSAKAATASASGGIATVDGFSAVSSNQANTPITNANASNLIVQIVTGPQTGTPNTLPVTNRYSNAAANYVGNLVALGLLGQDGTSNGAALAAAQANSGNIATTSNGNSFYIDIDLFSTGSATISGSQITATTNVNSSESEASGTIPATYDPTLPATQPGGLGLIADVTYAPFVTTAPQTVAQGSIASVTRQDVTGGASSATATNNSMYVNVDTVGVVAPMTSSVAVGNDKIDVAYNANNETSLVDVQSGGSPSFDGTAAIVSDQRIAAGANAGVAANNGGNSITVTIGGSGGAFGGSLALTGNRITSSATGNRALASDGTAGNVISLGDGMSYASPGLTPGTPTTNPLGLPAGWSSAIEQGGNSFLANLNDLSITSSQRAADPIWAQTNVSTISASVDDVDGASVGISGSLVQVTATQNVVGNSIDNGTGGASFAGTAAITNYQDATAGTTAQMIDSNIRVDLGGGGTIFTNTDASIHDNVVRGQAIGNSATQDLALASVELDIGSGVAGLFGGTDGTNTGALSSGNAIVNSYQHNDGAPVLVNMDSLILLNAPFLAVNDSGLRLLDNLQATLAIGNTADNSLSLSGNDVGTGAGINNVQWNDEGSPITAGTGATVSLVANAPNGTDLELSRNVQRALAYGNTASNDASVTAVRTTPGADSAPASIVLPALTIVDADYAVQNTQWQAAAVISIINPGALPALSVGVSGALTNSTLTMDGNQVIAGGYGNDATNALDLALGNTVATGFANIGSVTSAQQVLDDSGGVSASYSGGLGAGGTVYATVGGNVDPSQVALTDNQLQALAFGNIGDGSLGVSGTTVTAISSTPTARGSVDSILSVVDASFSVQSAQSVGVGSPIDAAMVPMAGFGDIHFTAGGDIFDSGVKLSGNTAEVGATANDAKVALSLDATTLAATAGALNEQSNSSDVSATLGSGGAGAGGVVVQSAQVGGTGTVSDSQVQILDNQRTAVATGNKGNSALSASADTMSGAGFNVTATVTSTDASADLTLGNAQILFEGASVTSTAWGLFSFLVGGTPDVTDSQIKIDGNGQSSSAIGNTASNSLTVDATRLDLAQRGSVNAALLSNQNAGGVDLSASSIAAFEAPASLDTSSLDITTNSVDALAILNQAFNGLGVDATNIDTRNAIASIDGTGTTTADFVLQNIQSGSGTVLGTATGSFFNNDFGLTPDVTGSSVVIGGNTVNARASVNEASNTASVAGGATNNASAALYNDQGSSGTVTATATSSSTSAPLTLGALGSSTEAIDGNTTSALAQGSGALNKLTVTGGQLNGSVPTNAVATGSSLTSAQADALLASTQSNSATINGSATATYGTALNGTATNSVQSVSGNSLSSSAFGNSVGNTLNVNGVGNGAGAAIANNQSNTVGTVTATSTANLQVANSNGASISGGSVAVGGNTVKAAAAANSAVNTLTYSGVQLQPINTAGGSVTYAAGVWTATGDAVVLNNQTNGQGGNVTATATINGPSISFAGSALNSSLSVSGNVTYASAVGNTAANTLAMTGVNNGASAVIGSVQTNAGNILATAGGGTLGVNIAGTVTNSAITVGGNTSGASAIGNNATNVISH